MSQSNAIKPARVAPDPDPADVFEINIATRPAPIWFEYAAMRDLHADVALTEDGFGLLLGSHSPAAFCVRRCEALHLGASTKSNPKALHNALREFIHARRQNPLAGAEQVAGFFRTQAAGWPEMLESDREIAKRYFRGANSLFLLIRTPAHRPWLAALFELDEKGAPASNTPTIEFPFDEYLLRNGYLTDLVEASEPVEVVQQPQNRKHWIVAAALFLLLAGGSAATYKYKWYRSVLPTAGSASTAASAGPLSLKVNRSGKDFEVSWDRLSAPVQQASNGLLTISDGALTRSVALSGPQLREGRILYTPLFEELNFRLEVSTPNLGAAAESVQVLAWSGKQPADVLSVAPPDPLTNTPSRIVTSDAGKLPVRAPETRIPVPAPPNPKAESAKAAPAPETAAPRTAAAKSAPVSPANAPIVNAPAPAANNTKQSPAGPGGKEVQPAKPSASETAGVIPPAASSATRTQEVAPTTAARVPETTPPAAASERPASLRTAPQIPTVTTQPQQPQAPAPKPEAGPAVQNTPATSTPPLPAAVSTSATGTSPAVGTFSGAIVLPVPIQRVAPSLPRSLPAAANGGAPRTVSVRVMVDSSGSVQSAEVVAASPKGAFGESLVKTAALNAAKLWKFRPGQVNGKSIAAEYTIDFQFR